MDQAHIGYTYWQQPARQRMPEIKYLPADSIKPPTDESDTTSLTAVHLIPKNSKGNIFYEQDTYVAIDAAHYTKAVNANGITWKILPDHGRTGSAITPFPVTAVVQKPTVNSPQLQYEFYTYNADTFRLNAYFSPTLNFHNTETGLQYAVAIDDDEPQIVSLNKEDNNNTGIWNRWVGNNIIIKTTSHKIKKPGKHIIKYWM